MPATNQTRAFFLRPLKCFTAAFVLLLMACQSDSKVKVLTLAHNFDQTTSVHQALVFMSQRLAELSSNTMRVDIYPNGQLGVERDVIELLQVGSIAMTKVSASPLEGFVPEMKIFSIPYVFNNEDHLWDFLQSDEGKSLLLKSETKRLRGLGYYHAGSRSFYSHCGTGKSIRAPSDLAGLKIRVQESQTSVQMIEALGGSATPIAWGELYTALQQGVIDAAENNLPSFYLSKHYEVCKLLILDEHTSVPDIVLISTRIWASLNNAQREWLQQAMDESIVYQRQLWAESTRAALEAVTAAGVEIIYPDKTAFSKKIQPMHDALKDDPSYPLLQHIKKL